MSSLADYYRKYMPIRLRWAIGKFRMGHTDRTNYERIMRGEFDEVAPGECAYLRSIGRTEAIPYAWTEEYVEDDIEVYKDVQKGMPYVSVGENKLYFPARYPKSYVRKYYNTIQIEQDPRSPHYYFDPKEPQLQGCTFLDVGAAEGYVSLLMAPVAKELILFECDPDWIKALQATFEPWKDKTTIINKYAGREHTDQMVCVDEIVTDKEKPVLKLDVEGMEQEVLAGAESTLLCSDTRLYVCTYHKQQDEEQIDKYLRDHG